MTLSGLLRRTDGKGIEAAAGAPDPRLPKLYKRLRRTRPLDMGRELILTVMEFDAKSPYNPGKVMDVSAYDVRANYFYSLSLIDFDSWLSLPVHDLSLRDYGHAPTAAAILSDMCAHGIGFRGDAVRDYPQREPELTDEQAENRRAGLHSRMLETCLEAGVPDTLEYAAEMDRRNDLVQEKFAARYRSLHIRQASGCSFIRGIFLADETEE